MNVVVRGPAVDEQPDADDRAEPDHENQSLFRPRVGYPIGLHAPLEDAIVE